MNLHVLTMWGRPIFGSLNIGRLEKTELIHITGVPVYKMADGKLVTCTPEMLKRINERLDILKW